MSVFRFTTMSLRSAPIGEHSDTLLPGLTIAVGKTRTKAFARPRIGGKRQRVDVGYFPAMSVAEIRQAYRDLTERLDAGAVPLPAAPHPRSADAASLGNLIDSYEVHRQREGAPKTMDRRLRAVRREFAAYLAMPANKLTKQDVRAVRDRLYADGRRSQWNDVRSALSTCLEFGIEEDVVDANVARSVKRAFAPKRERVLTEAELVAVWKATFDLERGGNPTLATFGRLTRFLILTALRRGEATGLRFGDIIDGTMRIPGDRMKAGKPHSLRLPQLALDQLGTPAESAELPARAFCFPSIRGRPLEGFSYGLNALHEASGTSGWSLHDLRRSAASGMQTLGIRPDIAEAILAHALPGLSAVAGVYLRGELEVQKAEALAVWSLHIERLVGAGWASRARR